MGDPDRDSEEVFEEKTEKYLEGLTVLGAEFNANVDALNTVGSEAAALLPYRAQIATTAGIAGSVVAVAGMADHVDSMDAVAALGDKVAAVAGIAGEVTRVAADRELLLEVRDNLPTYASVRDLGPDVTAVNSIRNAVATVALHIRNVDAVGARASEVDALAAAEPALSALHERLPELTDLHLHRATIDSVGNNMGAVLHAERNLPAILAAPEQAATARAGAREATAQADLARQHAESAAAVSGLPAATDVNDQQPVIWSRQEGKFTFGAPLGALYIPAPGIGLPPEIPVDFPVDVLLTGIAGIVGATVTEFSVQVDEGPLRALPAADGHYIDTIIPSGEPGAVLTYKATCTDDRGNTSLWNQSTAVLVEAFIRRPSVLAPAAGTLIGNASVTLTGSTFAAEHLADTHKASRWKISTDAQGQNVLYDSGLRDDALTRCDVVMDPPALADTTLYLFVQHQGTRLGLSSWSAPVAVKTSYVLAPAVVSPVAGAVVGTDAVTLVTNDFATYGGAFDIQEAARFKVTTDPKGDNALADSGWLSGVVKSWKATLDPVAPPSVPLYLWARKRGASLGASAWSAPVEVTTGSVAAPSISAPAAGAVVSPAGFTVTGGAFLPVAGATDAMAAMYVQVAADDAFVDLLYDSEKIAGTATSHAVMFSPHVDQGRTLYVRIRYEGQTLGLSLWSAPVSVVAARAVAPAITSPAAGAVEVPLTPSFRWSAYSDTGQLDTGINTRLQIAMTADFSAPVIDTGATGPYGTTYSVPASAALKVNTAYFARVRHRGALLGWTP